MMAPPGLRQLKDLPGLPIDLHLPAVRFVGDIAILRPDPQRAVAKTDGRHFAEVIPFAQVFSVQIESLDAGIVAVCDVDDSLVVYGNPVRLLELRRAGSRSPPLPHALAFRVVFQNAGIAIAVGDINPAVRSERDVAGSVGPAPARWLLAHRNLHQLFAFRRKLQDHRTSRIDRPDITLRVDADAMRDLVQPFSPRADDLAFTIQDEHGVGFLAAVEDVHQAGVVHRDRGRIADLESSARRIYRYLDSIEVRLRRLLDQNFEGRGFLLKIRGVGSLPPEGRAGQYETNGDSRHGKSLSRAANRRNGFLAATIGRL